MKNPDSALIFSAGNVLNVLSVLVVAVVLVVVGRLGTVAGQPG